MESRACSNCGKSYTPNRRARRFCSHRCAALARYATTESRQNAMRELINRRWAGHGGRLAQLRQSKGLTQTQLAQLIGMTRDSVARIEASKVRPHWHVWIRLADVFGITVDALKGGER